MSDAITVKKGDYGYNLNFTVKDSDGAAFNLTSYTITFKVWTQGKPGTLLVNAACTIDVAASGTCHYTIVDGDFPIAAVYKWELELTKTGVKDSTESANLTVNDSP